MTFKDIDDIFGHERTILIPLEYLDEFEIPQHNLVEFLRRKEAQEFVQTLSYCKKFICNIDLHELLGNINEYMTHLPSYWIFKFLIDSYFLPKYPNNEYIDFYDKDEVQKLVSITSKMNIDEIWWESILNDDQLSYFLLLISTPEIQISLK